MRKNEKQIRQRAISPFILFLMLSFLVIVIGALLAPVYAPVDLAATSLTERMKPPSFLGGTLEYWLGTDNLGRDFATRILYGTRTTIMISFTGMVFATLLGTTLGIIAGICRGKADLFITFLTDARLSIPTTFIGIICACVWGANSLTIIIVITITGWSAFSRLVRSQIIQLRDAKFIESSRAMGASGFRIIREHILVNVASPLIIQATMSLSNFILLESTLSFLGLGIQPPNTSLGVLVSNGRDYMLTNWWMAIFPSIIIILLILQIALVGDWLRDKLDPKLKNNS